MHKVLKKKITVALIGNPNTGKTTLFNSLCGTNQKTGNYPGVTVEKKVGHFTTEDFELNILDLPGLYSFRATSSDEKITLEVLTGKIREYSKPDLIFYVIDASNLKRNLYLLLQIMELHIPIIGIMTMIDIAEKKGVKIHLEKLKQYLGIPLFAVNAKNKKDIEKIKIPLNSMIKDVLYQSHNTYNVHSLYPINIQNYFQDCLNELKQFFVNKNLPLEVTYVDVFLCLTDQNEFLLLVEHILQFNKIPKNNIKNVLEDLKYFILKLKEKSKNYQIFSPAQLIQIRYKIIDEILKYCLHQSDERTTNLSDTLDSVLLHKIFGFVFFFVLMGIMFLSIYTWAEPLMNLIESFFNFLSKKVSESGLFSPLMESFINDGIIAGVGSVIVFVPQIAILFFFIAILEDTGYLARASFLMDKILSWGGLNGRSFIPLISGFACAVPAIMASRVINDDKVRKSTILITPLISCSARLPVYILFIGTFIEPKFGALIAGLCLFIMHSVGLLIAFIISIILNKKILKTPNIPFIMELPEYHIPSLRNIYFRVIEAVKNFLKRAGTIIFALSIVIWALSYFPRDEEMAKLHVQHLEEEIKKLKELEFTEDEAFIERSRQIEILEKEIEIQKKSFYLNHSYLGKIGKLVEPFFRPLGFDWKLSIGILSAFPAREVIISTLGIIYNVEDADEESSSLREKLLKETYPDGTPVYTPLTAISLMIFFALCAQCMSTLAIIKKELGSWTYPLWVFIYMTSLAYIVSFIVYQTGKLFLG